jgi:hypothetical protein
MKRCTTCGGNECIVVDNIVHYNCLHCSNACACCQSFCATDFCDDCALLVPRTGTKKQKREQELKHHLEKWMKYIHHIPVHKEFDERMRLYVGIIFDGTFDDCITYLDYLLLLYQKKLPRQSMIICRSYLAKLKFDFNWAFDVARLDVKILTLISKSL